VFDRSKGQWAAKRSRASAVTQQRRRSDDGGGEKRTSFSSFARCKGKIIFVVGIGKDIMGRIKDMQKRMHDFAKKQRKCYKKHDSHPNELNPMTQNCIWLLKTTKFNFKPSDTLKALAQEKKQAKTMDKEKKAAVKSQKRSSGESGTPMAESAPYTEKTALTKKPTLAKAKKSTPPEAYDWSSDCKIPAVKSWKQYSRTS
jgi:hypothetical protein